MELTSYQQIYCREGHSKVHRILPLVAADRVHKLEDVDKLAQIEVDRMKRPMMVVVVQIPDVVAAMDLEELQKTAADRAMKDRLAA